MVIMVESLNGEQSNRKCERGSGEKTSWDRSHRKPISYIIRLATATDGLLQPTSYCNRLATAAIDVTVNRSWGASLGRCPQLSEPSVQVCGPRHLVAEFGTGDRMFKSQCRAVEGLSGCIALVRCRYTLAISAVDRISAEQVPSFR